MKNNIKNRLLLIAYSISYLSVSLSAIAMDEHVEVKNYSGNKVKARLSNVDLDSWITCPQNYQRVIFDRFNGEKLEPPKSCLLIMENGLYYFSAKYAWKNITGSDPGERPGLAKTHIEISGDLKTVLKSHSIPSNGQETGKLEHTCQLKKGDRLCVTLYGNGHEQYGTKEFDLNIEKFD